MKLCNHLNEGTVCLSLQAKTKRGAIEELAQTLVDNPNLLDHRRFLEEVLAREAQSTTGIGGQVAIPHARTESVSNFVAAVGRSDEGIDFDSIDSQPVKLIILMGIPFAKVKEYLKLLAHLSLLFKQKDFIGRVLEAPDAGALIRTFAEHED